MSKLLTQDILKRRLHYNHITGVWTWKIATIKRKAGTIAGHTMYKGYVIISLFNKTYTVQTLAYLYMEGVFPPEGYEVDHIDTDKANNVYSNYRLATRTEQTWNSKMPITNKTSGIKGISADKQGNYRAEISVHGTRYRASFGKDLEAAANWITNLRNTKHKEFARHE
jgi:hypothetical protein